MIATIEKEATEYAHLLEMLSPDEHHLLVSSITKLKNNLIHQSLPKSSQEKSTVQNYSQLAGESGDTIIDEQGDLTSSVSFTEATQRQSYQRKELASPMADSNIYGISQSDLLIKKLTNNCSYSPAEKIELELETLQIFFEHRRELLSNSFTTTQVAKLLGTSRQTPHDRVKNKSLLAVRENGHWKFPSWQFDPEGADGVIDGLPEVLKNLSISSKFAQLNWFMRPNLVLDGLTPVEALKQGLKTRVIREAVGVGGASW